MVVSSLGRLHGKGIAHLEFVLSLLSTDNMRNSDRFDVAVERNHTHSFLTPCLVGQPPQVARSEITMPLDIFMGGDLDNVLGILGRGVGGSVRNFGTVWHSGRTSEVVGKK